MKIQNNQQLDIDAVINNLSAHGYVICKDFLLSETISALHDEIIKRHANQQMRAAATGLLNKTQQPDIRGDHTLWLDEEDKNSAIQAYFSQMHALKDILNQYLLMNLHSLETHFALYPIGGVYQKHLDQFHHGRDAKARQLSSILYLNADWQAEDGGELRLYLDENNYLDILPTAGKLVLFLSAKFWHEVRPAKRERASLAGWFRLRNQTML